MDGIDATNGKSLGGVQHLRQSLRDILTTPIGSRVMRRWYGSRIFSLVDAPMNRETITDIYAATAEALAAVNPLTGARVEPRFELTQVKIAGAEPGRLELDLTGNYLPDGQPITLDGIVIQ